MKGRCLNRLTKEPYFTVLLKLITIPSKPHIQNFKPSNSATVTLCVLKRSLISLQLTSCPLLRKCLPVLIRICECKHSHLLLIPVSRFRHFWSSPRPISSSQLHTLLHFHLCPIYLVVFKGSYFFRMGYLILRGASRLDAFSVYPFRTWLLCHAVGRQQIHQWSVHPGPLVLRTAPLRYPTPTPDRDRTVSRRSEPSSRTALMGEQPNPWDLLQPQDAMSRHRGAKPLRRCELLGVISLLSPG